MKRRILLSFSQQDGQDRAVLSSLYTRLMRNAEWSTYMIDPARLTPEAVAGMPLDALVGRVDWTVSKGLPKKLPILSTISAPIEAVAGKRFWVLADNAAIGRTGADYFFDRGAKNFAYVGSGRLSSQQRGRAFAERLHERGVASQTFLGPDTGVQPWKPLAVDSELTDWVRTLPSPTAVLAENDFVAFRISEICRHFQIQIPYAISLAGVGNDELMCRICHPSLTTIATPNEQIGDTLATMLDGIFRGEMPASNVTRLPPAEVIERQSAYTVRIDDSEVADAMRYIRENAHRPIAIEDIVSVIFTSRRTLERRFRRAVGMTLQAAITQARVDRAKGLLTYSRSPIQEVARLSGFTSVQRFHIVFRQTTKTTPLAYRQQFQPAAATATG